MLDSHIISAIGWTLIHFLWQGTAIVTIYWMISRSSNSLHAKYWTGMVAVMLCLLIPISQFISLIQNNAINGSTFIINNSYSAMAIKPMSAIDTMLLLVNQSLPYLVLMWAAVVAILTTGLMRSWFKLNAIEHDCDPQLSCELKQFIKNTAIKLDLATIPILKVSKKILVPAAYGIYKPTVLLPLSLMSQLPKDQIHAIITHEICHLKRNDFLHNILQLTADILLFFHPAIRWMNNDIRQVREQCCDQLVLSQNTHAITYAKALTNIASLTQGHSFGPRLQIGIHDGLLLKRVKYLLQNKSSQSSIMMFVPLAALMLACFYLFQSNHTGLTVSEPFINKSNDQADKLNKVYVSNLFYPNKPPEAAQTAEVISETVVNTLPRKTETPVQPEFNLPLTELQPSIQRDETVYIENKISTTNLTETLAMEEVSTNVPELESMVWSSEEKTNQEFNLNNKAIKATASLIKPKLKTYIAPEYPNEFWKRQIEQTVIASFKIKPNGKLHDIQLSSQGNNYVAFEKSVAYTLNKWRFEKSSLNPSSLQRTFQQIFEFNLSQTVEKNCSRATTGSRMKRAIACNK